MIKSKNIENTSLIFSKSSFKKPPILNFLQNFIRFLDLLSKNKNLLEKDSLETIVKGLMVRMNTFPFNEASKKTLKIQETQKKKEIFIR